jgi:hypothetical protein
MDVVSSGRIVVLPLALNEPDSGVTIDPIDVV